MHFFADSILTADNDDRSNIASQEFLLGSGQAVLHQQNGKAHSGGGQRIGKVLAGTYEDTFTGCAGFLQDQQIGVIAGIAAQAFDGKAIQAGFHLPGHGLFPAQQVHCAAGFRLA